MTLLQNLKKDKKGFTLVEMIVVIVIIGILLAILVPGMFKYIDQAKDKQVEVDARAAYMSIQAAVGTVYKDRAVSIATINKWFTDNSTLSEGESTLDLAGAGATITAKINIPTNGTVTGVKLDDNGGILSMTYTWNGTKKMEMESGVWKEVKPVETSTGG